MTTFPVTKIAESIEGDLWIRVVVRLKY